MLVVADRGGGGGKICQNLADVIFERSLTISQVWRAVIIWILKVKTNSVPKNCCRFLIFIKYDELIISSTYLPTNLINPHPLSNLPTHLS